MKDQDLVNLLNRAAAVIEDPKSEIKGDREGLVEDLLAVAQDQQLKPDAGEKQSPLQHSTGTTPNAMHDWRASVATEPDIDARPWTLDLVEGSEVSFRFHARCPDGTKRQVWIEIQDGRLVVHAYDPEHDEPVNLRIGKTGIAVDSDRDDVLWKHYDPNRSDAIEAFVQQVAGMSLPEEECRDAGHADVDEYVADLDDDRLCGEYATFMDMVRAAREVLK